MSVCVPENVGVGVRARICVCTRWYQEIRIVVMSMPGVVY